MSLFTSEQVGIGHPDKFCDRVSDTLISKIISEDKEARCAIETMAKGGTVVLAGEVTSNKPEFLYTQELYDTVSNIWEQTYPGYGQGIEVINLIEPQSPEINEAVSMGGAGDQGIMVGYANREEKYNYLPPSYYLASNLLNIAAANGIGVLGLDSKSQVTLDENNKVKHLVFSCQQVGGDERYFDYEMMQIVTQWAESNGINPKELTEDVLSINPGGSWWIGGPEADAGLTGRKVIADTYGPYVGHGGGAFSGKDYTKVDRSGAYMARAVAKNLVKQYDLDEVFVEIAYKIGYEDPVSVAVRGLTPERNAYFEEIIKSYVDLSPRGIADQLSLRDVDFARYCTLGHFTHLDAPWETVELKIG